MAVLQASYSGESKNRARKRACKMMLQQAPKPSDDGEMAKKLQERTCFIWFANSILLFTTWYRIIEVVNLFSSRQYLLAFGCVILIGVPAGRCRLVRLKVVKLG